MNSNNLLQNKTISFWMFLIKEYELVKNKKHKKITTLHDFYQIHNIHRQVFLKYYKRFQIDPSPKNLLPHKRGPHHTINPVVTPEIEETILSFRKQGTCLREIHLLLKQKYSRIPSISRIYQILKKHHLNHLSSPLRYQRQKYLLNIIKHHPGDLGHIDCHTINYNPRFHLQYKHILGLMDDTTRLISLIPVKQLTSESIFQATNTCLNIFEETYHIHFKNILSDNGIEFGGGPDKNNKSSHLFEVLLSKRGIKHFFTSIQHPETNGKIERFWKTLKADILSYPYFTSEQQFLNAIKNYTDYYNQQRIHSSLGITPLEKLYKL